MKVSLSWLKRYVDWDDSIAELSRKLTMAGLEVEKIEKISGESVFELEITPNRADCLSMLGISREVSAIFNKKLIVPTIKKVNFSKKKIPIEIKDKQACSYYMGVLIESVNIKKSSADILKPLKAIGIREVNNLVDITNFCLMETGQPLHVFDYDKIEGGKIIVRRARQGEKIVTIDSVERVLDSSILVIADAKKPVAIAGVMGGLDTEVTETTKNVLLESAYFNSILIRRASRKLGLSSDSSYRFERGVDFSSVESAAMRAINLIMKSTSGIISGRSKVLGEKPRIKSKSVKISIKDINSYLGDNISVSKCKTILARLGFTVSIISKENFMVAPPTFRSDIRDKVDLIEEVARVIGYDNIPVEMPHVRSSSLKLCKKRKFRGILRNNFIAQGFNEALTYSLIHKKSLEISNLEHLKCSKLKNPLSQDQEFLRPSMLPGLINAVAYNINRGQKELKFFEIGKIYSHVKELHSIGIIMCGFNKDDWRVAKKQKIGYYDLKGSIEQSFRRLGLESLSFKKSEEPFFQLGCGASVYMNDQKLGVLGKVSESVLKNWGIKEKEIYFAQVEIELLGKDLLKTKNFNVISEYPSISRDISLSVKKNISFDQIKDLIFSLGESFLVNINFIEEYLGEEIIDGCRGLVFSLVYQSKDRTLKEKEVQEIQERVVCALCDKFLVTIR